MAGTKKTRRRSTGFYVRDVPRKILDHPNNRHRKARALAVAGVWQLYKRVVRQPLTLSLPGGLKVRCYPDSTTASNLIYFRRVYEYNEMEFARRYLRSGDGFIDGGSNIGVYTLLAAPIVGPLGHIDAFEPVPLSADRLRENVQLNQLERVVTVHEIALAERAGVAEFLTSLDVSNRLAQSHDVGAATIRVTLQSLDAVLPAGRKYALAKLDLEGAEVAALRGAERHVAGANPPVWQFEVLDARLRKMGTSREDLEAIFGDNNYEFAVYDADTNGITWSHRLDFGRSNMLAVASSAKAELLARLYF